MSPAQQKVIDDHCIDRMGGKFADPWADLEHAGLEKIGAMPGHEVYKITRRPARPNGSKSAEPLHKKWADAVKQAGGDADAIMKELKDVARAIQRRIIDADRRPSGPCSHRTSRQPHR